MSAAIHIRPAERGDVELIYSLIVELAEYERSRDQVSGTAEFLSQALFGEHPSAEALIAEVDAEPVAFALYHGTFSTWECRPGIWLEDLYVPPAHRRSGIGRALFAAVAAVAATRGCTRLEWAALNWNAPALTFYENLNAKRLDEWVMHRLDGQALHDVAAEAEAETAPAPGG